MARGDVRQPFLEQQVERGAQTEQVRDRRRVREVSLGVVLDLIAQVEERARALGLVEHAERLLAHAEQADSRAAS